MKTIVHDFLISNKLGLHARPAALFVQAVSKYEADVKVVKDDQEVNGKSIMGIMTLAAGKGSVVKVEISGTDADASFEELKSLFDNNFGED